MHSTTIRSTLLSLIRLLGAVICVLVGLELVQLFTQYRELQSRHAENLARNQLAGAGLALSAERDRTYLSLRTGAPVDPQVARQTDQLLNGASAAVQQVFAGDAAPDRARAILGDMGRLREGVAQVLDLPLLSPRRDEVATLWFEGVSAAAADLRDSRIRLLANSRTTDAGLFGLSYLRTYALVLMDELMKSATLLEADAARRAAGGGEALPPIPESSAVAAAAGPYQDFVAFLEGQAFTLGVDPFDAVAYAAAERQVRQALQEGRNSDAAMAKWITVSRTAIAGLDALQNTAFAMAQERLATLTRETRREILLWIAVLAAAVVIVVSAVRVVLAWVVTPLEQMRQKMLRLAEDDLSVDLPKTGKTTEIRAMEDALRVFKANATRRQRLQSERLMLHGRLEETYRHLKNDLEAAAVIQTSLLPQASQISGVALSSYFRPSNFLAGDTFDVLQQTDGNIIVFQIDVAGHGAGAALVSVASQYTVAQTILQRHQGSSVADLVEQINRDWPEDLPFFTLILAEIDPEQGHGTLVQAGHPCPLLLTAEGALQILGNGGLPIGVLGEATYENIPFRFRPGDRLLVATDGAHELANAEGEIFSEERLYDLLRACASQPTHQILANLDESLRRWRGDDTLDDDVTIVVLEGRQGHGDDGRAKGGPADPATAGRAA